MRNSPPYGRIGEPPIGTVAVIQTSHGEWQRCLGRLGIVIAARRSQGASRDAFLVSFSRCPLAAGAVDPAVGAGAGCAAPLVVRALLGQPATANGADGRAGTGPGWRAVGEPRG